VGTLIVGILLLLSDSLRYPQERHLRNVRQLTFGGNNAEAYFSFDGRWLIFQSDDPRINPQGCDQQFIIPADGSAPPRLVSTGRGRTTCGFFLKDGTILYASTHAANPACPQAPMFVGNRYVWPVYADYDIYHATADGHLLGVLIGGPGYDAEATVSPDGRYVVFTSARSGDLDLWRLDLQTGELLQLTHELGYDGGAVFSPDGSLIAWRRSVLRTAADSLRYRELLEQGFVEPTEMEIWVMRADGSQKRQLTRLGGANWAPFFHPSGKKIIFASNHHTLQSKRGRQFNLFLINLDGTGLQQITFDDTFDAFPMFSPDGRRLVWCSNRFNGGTRNTNVFVADWVEEDTP
jgi:TolB protein